MNPIDAAKEILELDKKITPGPWRIGHAREGITIAQNEPGFSNRVIAGENTEEGIIDAICEYSKVNKKFIVLSRTAAPLLAREVIRLTEEKALFEEVREMLEWSIGASDQIGYIKKASVLFEKLKGIK